MTNRKKKLRIIQIFLLLFGCLILFFTYYQKNNFTGTKIVTTENQEKVKKELQKNNLGSDVFYNIQYSGLDLSGNRFILKSNEAISSKDNKELVDLKKVEAIFYFKDDTVLKVWSDLGKYNNKTLDITFKDNVKSFYEDSELYADKAEFSNFNGYLIISENVKVIDENGDMNADKLTFDINLKTLNIESFKNKKINANLKIQ
jgi:hypothetical protein|tara:strand:+ start:1006 stop:1611 length:606 start_codon:yes stop_codon:yes gene_type:complete